MNWKCWLIIATLCFSLNRAVGQEIVEGNNSPSDIKTTQVEPGQSISQDKSQPVKYEFTLQHGVDCSPVKSQDATGTCWSFATASFIESELMRRDKGDHNISEMFIVKNIYQEKARNYVLRQGKANFSEGALAHDFIGAAARYGFVPEEVYAGKADDERHDHGEMNAVALGMLKAVVKLPRLNPKWETAYGRVIETYLGETPERFTYRGQSYSPKEFAESLDFRQDDYLSLSSFSHHPFYEKFVLEIPDNFSNGQFYNVPIDDLIETIDHAIENGFSVAWDGDVSERGFSAGNGIAVLPTEPGRPDLFDVVGAEVAVDQDLRQAKFMNLETMDDHLMHLTGIATDPAGNKYYLIKNSWGEAGPYKGYLYISEAYVRMKTIAILVHRDGAPSNLRVVR